MNYLMSFKFQFAVFLTPFSVDSILQTCQKLMSKIIRFKIVYQYIQHKNIFLFYFLTKIFIESYVAVSCTVLYMRPHSGLEVH